MRRRLDPARRVPLREPDRGCDRRDGAGRRVRAAAAEVPHRRRAVARRRTARPERVDRDGARGARGAGRCRDGPARAARGGDDPGDLPGRAAQLHDDEQLRDGRRRELLGARERRAAARDAHGARHRAGAARRGRGGRRFRSLGLPGLADLPRDRAGRRLPDHDDRRAARGVARAHRRLGRGLQAGAVVLRERRARARLRLHHDARRHAALRVRRAARSARRGPVPGARQLLGLRPVAAGRRAPVRRLRPLGHVRRTTPCCATHRRRPRR